MQILISNNTGIDEKLFKQNPEMSIDTSKNPEK